MTLSFMTHWHHDKSPTYFVEKILASFPDGILSQSKILEAQHYDFNPNVFIDKVEVSKKHTIRFLTLKQLQQWNKPGREIHFVINNRTPRRFQFGPLVPVASVQPIHFEEVRKSKTDFTYKEPNGKTYIVVVGGKILTTFEIIQLAINDGFETTDDFFSFFNQELIESYEAIGKKPYIIHWTNLKY